MRSGWSRPNRPASLPAEPKPRLGDRVEAAVEERADAERAIERGEAEQPSRRKLIVRGIWLAVTAVSLYIVAPSVLDELSSWKQVTHFSVGWLGVMAALQVASLACIWVLQALAMHTRRWYAVVTSQLAGNALGKVAPGGGAVGAALQYRMLAAAGLRRPTAVSGLTAVNVMTFAVVLAMPVFAIPAIIRGAVDRSLVEATIIGAVVFVAIAALGAACLALDGPLRWIGGVVQRARNRMRRHATPVTGLASRLLRERDRLLATIGARWQRALLATVGRWAFDYATLLAALAALGARPKPSLVLLAFCAAQLLAQVPITPGGLGFVEAGLTATLKLAGVGAGTAVLATFAYRLFSYWLPLPVGGVGFLLHRRRYAAGAS